MASSGSETSSSDDMQVEELPDHSPGGWLGLSSWRISGWFSQPTEDEAHAPSSPLAQASARAAQAKGQHCEGSACRIVLDGRCLCIGQCVCIGPGDPSGGVRSPAGPCPRPARRGARGDAFPRRSPVAKHEPDFRAFVSTPCLSQGVSMQRGHPY
eukprot:CAMPEP_0183439938 /NCGR_PEP_ID=MMETSP0370-20130417/79739_1 /TAXON_ID=268820 /ORGANISM="Peridinium aciculiferum, Strain PAER-2" /LENGTH=154 /DNA_ID=CAMNT_0025628593 /DNA_START=42 /DNA_END=506 /DNA_ORIENTATION=-